MQVAGRTISKYSIALLVIVLIGVFLRVYHLDAQSLWVDEVYDFLLANISVKSIVVMSLVTEVATPQDHLLLHLWMTLFGTSLFALRFLSLIFGVFAILMIYLLGRRLFNEEVGLISALILAISPLNIEYSQEARMYSLVVFLALLSMYFFVLLLEPGSLRISLGYILLEPYSLPSSLFISLGYILSTTLLWEVHPFGLFVLSAQIIFVAGLLLLSRQRRSRLKLCILSQVIAVIVFIPEIHFLLSKQAYAATNYVSFSYANPISLVLPLAAGRWDVPRQHCLDDTSPWVGCILTVHLPKSSTESF